MAVERWLPVVGCEGLYEVSDYGHVQRLTKREGYHSEPLSVPAPVTLKRTGKYLGVTLKREGWSKRFTVQILVLEAFVGPRPGKTTGSHLDGDRAHNALSNLAWESMSANHLRKRAHKTMLQGERHPHAKLTEAGVLQIRASSHSHSDLALEFGVSRSLISMVKRREIWSHI